MGRRVVLLEMKVRTNFEESHIRIQNDDMAMGIEIPINTLRGKT